MEISTMSYRTYIEDVQVFGNNESYPEWFAFIRSQGIDIDEDGCYEGDVHDVMGMFAAIDKITRQLVQERDALIAEEKTLIARSGHAHQETPRRPSPTDFSSWVRNDEPILATNMRIIDKSCLFAPYRAYLAIKDELRPARQTYHANGLRWDLCSYEPKDGDSVRIDSHMRIVDDQGCPEWIAFATSQGMVADEKGRFEGDVRNVMGMFAAIDTMTRRLLAQQGLEKKTASTPYDLPPRLADFSSWIRDDEPILAIDRYATRYSYLFMPYVAYIAVRDKLRPAKHTCDTNGLQWGVYSYELKDGASIRVEAR
jgi:hypothetical protein